MKRYRVYLELEAIADSPKEAAEAFWNEYEVAFCTLKVMSKEGEVTLIKVGDRVDDGLLVE